MRRNPIANLIGCLAVLLLVVTACGPSGPSEEELAQEAEWNWLQEAKVQLDAERVTLADLRAAFEAATDETEEAEVELVEGEEALPTREELEAQVEAADEAVMNATDEFGQRLVDFINSDPMIQGEPPTERQLAAIRMKSSEDIVLAQEYIEKGGDYRRAIDIFETTLLVDPENEEVKAALEDATANRWMSEERFSLAEKGMTQAEVRSLLGQVNLHNIQDYPDKAIVAWFYPSSPEKTAAQVWFRNNSRTGEMEVYQLKYEGPPEPETEEE